MLKIAVFADINLNLVDGSTIWLKNICTLISDALEDVEVTVFSREKVVDRTVVGEIDSIKAVSVAGPDEICLLGSLDYKALPADRLSHIAKLWEKRHGEFDYILCRGYSYSLEFLRNKYYREKLVVYWVYEHKFIGYRRDELLDELRRNNTKIIAQTKNTGKYLEVFGQVFSGNIHVLPPIVDRSFFDFQCDDRSVEDGICLSYSGKIDADYCVLDALEAVDKVGKEGLHCALVLCQGKLNRSKEIPDFLDVYGKKLKKIGNIALHKNVQHSKIKEILANSEIGFCLRSSKYDSSLELSTKIVEYCALLIPPLINATAQHIEIFGNDYPLMIDYRRGEVEKVVELLINLKQEEYKKAVATASRVAKKYMLYAHTETIRDIFLLKSGAYEKGVGLVRKRKMLISGCDFKFLSRVENRIKAMGLEVEKDVWSSTSKPVIPRDEFKWDGDVIFCEWCCAQAVWFSKNKKPGQILIIRLHRFEMFTDVPKKVVWRNVDYLIVVNHEFRRSLISEHSIPEDKVIFFPQFVESDHLDRPKFPSSKYAIGFVGINPYHHKRFDRALDFFSKLIAEDERFILRVRSMMPWSIGWLWDGRKDEVPLYKDLFSKLMNDPVLRRKVRFDEPGTDMEEWFREVSFVLSSSDTEGCHTGVLEGMASGCMPIVYKWPGAVDMFPKDFVYDSLDSAVDDVIEFTEVNGDVGRFKKFVRQYDSEKFVALLKSLALK